jgi:hypothetical protein
MNQLKIEVKKFRNEWLKLKDQWEKTSTLWNDGVKNRFEIEFWQELERDIPAFIKKVAENDERVSIICREIDLKI